MQQWTTTAQPERVADLRRAVVGYARDNGLCTDRVDDVALAVTELVSNAVVHAYRDQDDPGAVTVEVARDDGMLLIRVADHGLGLIPRDDSPGAGLGLQIAAMVADDLHVEPLHPRGTAVKLTFAAAA
jgi:anti-sigma regulatory factor (Ser/Thr protein kinase)